MGFAIKKHKAKSMIILSYCKVCYLPGALYTSFSKFSLSANGIPKLWDQLW